MRDCTRGSQERPLLEIGDPLTRIEDVVYS